MSLHTDTDTHGIVRGTLARPERHDAFDQAADAVVTDWLAAFFENRRLGWSA